MRVTKKELIANAPPRQKYGKRKESHTAAYRVDSELHHRMDRIAEKTGLSRAKSLQALVKLADDLHYLRYAPKLSSTDGLKRELVERSRKLARNLK